MKVNEKRDKWRSMKREINKVQWKESYIYFAELNPCEKITHELNNNRTNRQEQMFNDS